MELGFLRKRTYSTSGCTANKGNLTGQLFKQLIVIDFESTCWQEAKFRTQEIIEFPAVLLNTVTGQIESEFHYYVQPQEQPVLSSFCTGLTGITQSQVDEGIPINLCLRKFTHWLDKLYREKNVVCEGTRTDQAAPVNCTCVTWSDWDLGVCLQYECKRKQLLKPAQLNSWIDLRATYRKFYDRKPNGLNGALQDLGIEFQGREHSGVDDARNTAKLAFRMIKDGCILKTTKTLKTHERSSSCNVQFRDKPVQRGLTRTISPQHTVSSAVDIRTFIGNKQITKTRNQTPKKLTPNKTGKITPSKITPKTKKEMPKKAEKSTSTKITPKRNNRTPNKETLKKIVTSPSSNITKSKVSEFKTPTKASPKTHKTIERPNTKRKQITPVKASVNRFSDSPCRKIPRIVSPKKCSAFKIYRDPVCQTTTRNSNNAEIGRQSPNRGLQEHDMNVQETHDMIAKRGLILNTEVENAVAELKQPSPVSGGQKCSYGATNTFKIPQPVGKSAYQSPRRNQQRNTFYTSTPLTENAGQSLSHKCSASPIQLKGTQKNCKKQIETPKVSNMSNNSCQSSSFKTPSMTSYNGTGSFSSCSTSSSASIPSYIRNSNYSRPGSSSSNDSRMKITPPLCKCGRRSKRRMVQTPGQNMGRFFFTCTVRQNVASKKGCDFFKWESSLNYDRSASFKNVSKQYTPVIGNKPTNVFGGSGPQKRNLGVRSNNSQRVLLRQ